MPDRAADRKRFWAEHDEEEYECPRCGRGIDEVDGFEVHHIDHHPENGHPENLVALCIECHWDEHDISPGKRHGHWSERFFNEYKSDESPLKYL